MDSHPIRSRPARPRDCSRSRPSGRTEQSLGVCLAQRPLYYAAVQALACFVGRSSPPRPAAPPAAPLCTTGGGIIENNRQTGDEREATSRSTDTQTQRAYASVHRSIAVTRPAASTNSIRQSLQGICTISCIAGEIPALARSEIRARMTGRRGDRTPRR